MTVVDRMEALRDLLWLRKPVADAIQALRAFSWDSESELLVLRRQDATRLLDAFLQNNLTDADCESWANAIEGREDIAFENEHENLLKDFVFELATPEATRALTRESADEWRRRLDM